MDEGISAIGEAALERGRGAAGRWEWAEAYAALSQADASAGMGPSDLELLATAAHLMGHVRDSIGALQRAYQLRIDAGEVQQGVRCAFWLGYHLINSGDFGQAQTNACWPSSTTRSTPCTPLGVGAACHPRRC